MMDAEDLPIPDGWELTQVGAVVKEIQPGFASGRHNGNAEGLPHLRPMNVSTTGKIDRSVIKYIDPALAARPERRLHRGDVLFNNTNSLDLVGKTAYFDEGDSPAFSNHMTRLRTDPEQVLPEYLARYLHGCWTRGDFTQLANNHVSQASISRKVLSALPVPLPPISQQYRIVELLNQIDQLREVASADLTQARSTLTNFRRSILIAVCSGRLTEEWRLDHPGIAAVGADELVARRRSEQGGRLKEVKPNQHASDAELPEGWSRMPLGFIIQDLKYGTSKKSEYTVDGTPVIRIPNVSGPTFDLDDLKYTALSADEQEDLALRPGDLLLIRSNGSAELVGKAMSVPPAAYGMAFAGYLIRLRLDRAVIDPAYAELAMASPDLRVQIEMPARSTSGVHNINSTEVRNLILPLPPLEEQAEIVRRAEALLAGYEEALGRVEIASSLLIRTGRAALVKAFRGELVEAAR